MRKKIFSFAGILSALLLWGCYPHGPEYTQDLDVVVTHHNPDYDFVAKATYALPNKIVKITGNLKEGDPPEFIPDVYAAQILARIESNMTALGWTKVGVDASPDLMLLPAAWETTYVYYWYDYWSWWYGGYYPSYPYYPPVYVSSYTTGSLLMTIQDPTQLGGNGNPVNQWTAILNGVLNGSYNATRMNGLIDQAFTQSQYLKTN
jgi:hypothetical protein